MESIDIKNEQLILEDKSQYFYSIRSVEVTNALGAVVATLLEYSISNNKTLRYKLYKTKEGTWYDISDSAPSAQDAVLLSLKRAINSHEIAK